MYEEMTFENILSSALENVSGDIDKREGSVVYDAIAPACAELAKAYIELDRVLDECFADTQSREYLIRRAAERGVEPNKASYAKVLANLSGDFSLSEGARFNLGEVNYIYEGESSVTDEGEILYILRCEASGTAGNYDSGRLIPIESISGLEKAEVVGIFSYGEEEEDTEDFRERYFESVKNTAFGGNISDYKQKVKAIDGVGGVKVYPHFYGGGTVKLVIIDGGFTGEVSEEFLRYLAETIDPPNNSGEGRGIAPIGHKVSVFSAESIEINIELSDITYSSGYDFESTKENILEVTKEYFTELNKEFEDSENITVNNYRLGSRLLSVEGILNIGGIKISGNSGNFELSENQAINISAVSVSEAV